MAARSAQGRRASQDVGLLVRTPDQGRRSHSIGDDTPRPTGLLYSTSSGTSASTPGESSGSPPNLYPLNDLLPPKKLGFFGEKLLSSSSGSSNSTLRPNPNIALQLLPTRSQSRADTLASVSRDTAVSPTPGISNSSNQTNKGHTSPSKSSGTRTYDSTFISREMHRLGSLAHLPGSLSSASSTTNLPATASGISSHSNSDSPWMKLHVYVLPLFNRDALKVPIEDLNGLVRRHIQSVVSAAPAKAIATLENDAHELISAGMVNLTAELSGIEEEKLVSKVVEVWAFFWDRVLPYVEGALLPLQTDPILSALYRTPKGHKPTSPVAQSGKGSMSGLLHQSTPQIDVRTIALQSFRDGIIVPYFPILNARLLAQREHLDSTNYQQPRLQQMLLVLVSQRTLPSVLSLTEAAPQPTPGEAAIQNLLRAIHTPLSKDTPNMYHRFSTRAPSFLSAGLPRDRRGRIDMKGYQKMVKEEEEGDDGGDTPRMVAFGDGREKGREFLESLRSPDLENASTGMGGWGLAVGQDDRKVSDEQDDDNDSLDWESTQAVVERMVGMKGDNGRARTGI